MASTIAEISCFFFFYLSLFCKMFILPYAYNFYFKVQNLGKCTLSCTNTLESWVPPLQPTEKGAWGQQWKFPSALLPTTSITQHGEVPSKICATSIYFKRVWLEIIQINLDSIREAEICALSSQKGVTHPQHSDLVCCRILKLIFFPSSFPSFLVGGGTAPQSHEKGVCISFAGDNPAT